MACWFTLNAGGQEFTGTRRVKALAHELNHYLSKGGFLLDIWNDKYSLMGGPGGCGERDRFLTDIMADRARQYAHVEGRRPDSDWRYFREARP